jgi:cell division protein DivIC
MWHRIPPFFRNKYFIAGFALLVWLIFFDRNNFIAQVRLGSILNEQRQQKEFYHTEIKRDSAAIHDILADSVSLEKFAREKYLMKKDNEDIFMIVEEKEAEEK